MVQKKEKNEFFGGFICIYQKKAVSLHAELRNSAKKRTKPYMIVWNFDLSADHQITQ